MHPICWTEMAAKQIFINKYCTAKDKSVFLKKEPNPIIHLKRSLRFSDTEKSTTQLLFVYFPLVQLKWFY